MNPLVAMQEYFSIHGPMDVMSKTDTVTYVRDHGEAISDRAVIYYNSVGLLPGAIRVGRRDGVYPRAVADQLLWVVRYRKRGVSIEVLQQLLPVWKMLERCRIVGSVSVSDVAAVLAEHVTKQEAAAWVPQMLLDVLYRGCSQCRRDIAWTWGEFCSTHVGVFTFVGADWRTSVTVPPLDRIDNQYTIALVGASASAACEWCLSAKAVV